MTLIATSGALHAQLLIAIWTLNDVHPIWQNSRQESVSESQLSDGPVAEQEEAVTRGTA